MEVWGGSCWELPESRAGDPQAGGSVPLWEPELQPPVPPGAGGGAGDIRDAALGLLPQSPLAAARHRYRQRLMRCQCTTRSYFGNTLALLILPAVTARGLIRFLRLCLLFIKLSKASACHSERQGCSAPRKKPVTRHWVLAGECAAAAGWAQGSHPHPPAPGHRGTPPPPQGSAKGGAMANCSTGSPPVPLPLLMAPLPCPRRSPPA